MYKGQDLFLDHFARLGVFSKVSSLVGPLDEDREEEGATAQVKRVSQIVIIYFLLFFSFLLTRIVETRMVMMISKIMLIVIMITKMIMIIPVSYNALASITT